MNFKVLTDQTLAGVISAEIPQLAILIPGDTKEEAIETAISLALCVISDEMQEGDRKLKELLDDQGRFTVSFEVVKP
jgi:hypothetical protein